MGGRKKHILKRIAENLAKFYPEHANAFMCPTCLTVIPFEKQHEISEAHIIPRFADGTLKTFLCRRCNSQFGANQDKWLGEFLKVRASGKSLFSTTKQTGRFLINDVPVSGTFREDDDGGLAFCIWDNKTSPDSLKQLEKISKADSLSVSAAIPLIQNSYQVEFGLLTAAYLMWFKEIGYSWVLQDHMQAVREQIRSPVDSAAERPVVGMLDEPARKPWIGIVEMGNTAFAAAGISQHVVFLPTLSTPSVYNALLSMRGDRITTQHQKLRFSDGHRFDAPFGIVYKDKAIVASHLLAERGIEHVYLRYDGVSETPTVLRPCSEAEAKHLEQSPDVVHISISPEDKPADDHTD